MAMAIPLVQTTLIVFFDDYVFVKPQFLRAVAAVFEDPRVCLCGTKKSAQRTSFQTDLSPGNYWVSVWNSWESTGHYYGISWELPI